MNKNPISIEQLEAMSKNFSNFGGDPMLSKDFTGYTGEGDDMLDFAGGPADSFADAVDNKRIFTMTLVNAAVATRIAYLFGGYANPTGEIADGAFNDANGNAGLTGTGTPNTIANFKAYIKNNPSLLLGFRVKSTDATQMDQQITWTLLNPFKVAESRNIVIANYVDENNFNDKIATVTEGGVVSIMTQVQIPIVASSTATITAYFGPSLNNHRALENKTEKAKKNIFIMGGPGVVKKQRALRG
jgi:hypothetical protein